MFCASLHTDPSATADEYAVRMRSVLGLYEVDPRQLAGAILSCVVPSLLQPVRKALGLLYPGRLYVVGPGLKTGLQIRMDDPGQLGGELVCAAVAAKEQYPLPCVVVSLDTATTLLALDEDGVLRGGALVAGVRTGVDALCARAAQLPQVDLAVPACGVLGSGSVTCVQAGAVFGTASMIDGMVDRYRLLCGHRRAGAPHRAPLRARGVRSRAPGPGWFVRFVSAEHQILMSPPLILHYIGDRPIQWV